MLVTRVSLSPDHLTLKEYRSGSAPSQVRLYKRGLGPKWTRSSAALAQGGGVSHPQVRHKAARWEIPNCSYSLQSKCVSRHPNPNPGAQFHTMKLLEMKMLVVLFLCKVNKVTLLNGHHSLLWQTPLCLTMCEIAGLFISVRLLFHWVFPKNPKNHQPNLCLPSLWLTTKHPTMLKQLLSP